ncbi:uncharacterized protein LOC113523093 isoform X3 [Galleria mellonella]|uniref:Uncharacterized protein LOC113523093 isoform X3 n=1 Tax=Galleria mellonella TaxID=7137 RepID=A0ABM3MQH8_GALME|nr:uncharacterized protein LOC113523093 isoform X3 [Galleria mellonella]XP_052753625.1 uncharacterized protein LOC113523093 isoform X3 [Galleria mellonella]XP_052753626.1 uncharacterized protein LOC113523093 isoform X3 [Galleria mellonella]
MTATDNLSAEDKEFLAKCEEELKDRYTDKDEEFMKVFNADAPKPPIIPSWWVPQGPGRRNDRRNNRRDHSYDRYGNRDDRRGFHHRRDNHNRRHYNDYHYGGRSYGNQH